MTRRAGWLLGATLACSPETAREGQPPATSTAAERSAAASASVEAAPSAGADAAWPDLAAALAALPEAARRDATVIVSGTFYRERGAHVNGVWHMLEGYRVTRVFKGTVRIDRIGVRAGTPPQLTPGRSALVALRPSARSRALLEQDRDAFTHLDALEPAEILAVVP